MLLSLVSASHYIVGIVNDALDGTSANDHTVVLWNPANGIDDNLTDIIGPNGNSNTDNIYMIDCELLNNPCEIGDELRIKVINNGDNYITSWINLSVTGAGYDLAPNLTLNSPPNVTLVIVDDSLQTPENEIDLTAATTKKVTCKAVVEEIDTVINQDQIKNASAEFFDNTLSFYGDSDDNNYHYTNNSCYINTSYGNENESEIICSFDVWYYANSGEWNCTVKAFDNLSIEGSNSDTTSINPLLSIGIETVVDFGIVDVNKVSSEAIINVTNFGNVKINLSLSGYAFEEGDGLAMNCTLGAIKNISIDYEKYNLTASNPGQLSLTEFENLYTNLTSNPVVEEFNLNYRQNDTVNKATNETYWRIYVPTGVAGTCQGNIVFAATQAAAG